MSIHAYDTLGTSKKLAAAGMERRQAEAVAIAIAERQGNLATKSDIEKLDSRFEKLDSRFEKMDSRFEKMDSRFERLNSGIERLNSGIERLDSGISSLRTEFKSEMSSLRTEFKSGMNLFRSEIRSERKTQFRWLLTMQFATIFAIVTLAYAVS